MRCATRAAHFNVARSRADMLPFDARHLSYASGDICCHLRRAAARRHRSIEYQYAHMPAMPLLRPRRELIVRPIEYCN